MSDLRITPLSLSVSDLLFLPLYALTRNQISRVRVLVVESLSSTQVARVRLTPHLFYSSSSVGVYCSRRQHCF